MRPSASGLAACVRVMLAGLVVGVVACTAPGQTVDTAQTRERLPFLRAGIACVDVDIRMGAPAASYKTDGVFVYKLLENQLGNLENSASSWNNEEQPRYDLILHCVDGAVVERRLIRKAEHQNHVSRKEIKALERTQTRWSILLQLGDAVERYNNDRFLIYPLAEGNKGYALLDFSPSGQLQRSSFVDRDRWSDHLQEGLKSTMRYWQFADPQTPEDG